MFALKNVLVATDFGEASEAALLYGRNFARVNGARLHLLHVVGFVAGDLATPIGMPGGVGDLQTELERDATHRLNALVSDEDRRDLGARATVVSAAGMARAILDYAVGEKIDLIIVGTHGRTGLAHFFLGSVAQQVVRTAPCPVLTVRHPEREFALPDALEKAGSV